MLLIVLISDEAGGWGLDGWGSLLTREKGLKGGACRDGLTMCRLDDRNGGKRGCV